MIGNVQEVKARGGPIIAVPKVVTITFPGDSNAALDPPDAAPLQETLDAIERANLITVGPGSLYTSLITNLLVDGIPAALTSARGIRVFICNLMTQANESLGLTASQHIERIYEHARAPIFDCALINTAPFSAETLARYAAEGAYPIQADIERVQALGVRCIAGNFASEDSVVRHEPDRVTDALLALGRTRGAIQTSVVSPKSAP